MALTSGDIVLLGGWVLIPSMAAAQGQIRAAQVHEILQVYGTPTQLNGLASSILIHYH